MHLGVNLRPLLRGDALQHRTKGNGYGLRLLPDFFDRAGLCPRQRFGFFLDRIESSTAEDFRQAAGHGKLKRIRPTGLQQKPADMTVHYAHHALPIRLIERIPRQKAPPRPRPQTRRSSRRARTGSRKNITPKREVARSKLFSGAGHAHLIAEW
jgi:hypothetical protein